MFELKAIATLIVCLPLGAAVLIGILNRRLSHNMTHRLAVTTVGLAFMLACVVLKRLVWDDVAPLDTTLYTWGKSGDVVFQIGFLIDRLSAVMMVVVTFISWMVHIYTIGYMREDAGYRRFFSYIALFTFSMLMLVMSNNCLQLFFGWEAVGVVSYWLIGFWFHKERANRASLKAFLVNRISDLGFLMGIAAILQCFGSLDYQTLFRNVGLVAAREAGLFSAVEPGLSIITFICLSLFLGAMGKSAQMPFHAWLPDSMEGPTPISALIHAATMVTAGVFMIARFSPLFEYSDTALSTMLWIGALTAVLMGILGVVQNDIKRIIAYSTLSQLGYMIVAMGASVYTAGIFHLVTHAFFKALLFLGAGSVIVVLHHEQNIWNMGNLRRYMPITYITFLIGSLALMGFPFFSGFYSKDLIIEAVGHSNLPYANWVYWGVLANVFITGLYTFRLFFVVFHTRERFDLPVKTPLRETSWALILPLLVLALPSIGSGALLIKPMMTGFFGSSIVTHAHHPIFLSMCSEFKGALQTGLEGFTSKPFWLGMGGGLTAWLCYVRYPTVPAVLKARLSGLYAILAQGYGFDALYERVIAAHVRKLATVCWQFGDQGIIDGLGVQGSARMVVRASTWFGRFQTGYLYHYVFVMIIGFLVLVACLMLA